MKVELRKLAIYPRLSKETIAFNAVVYIDGEKIGHAENDGHGGATLVFWSASSERRAEIEAALKCLVPSEFAAYTDGTEWAIDAAVDKARSEKERVKNDVSFKRRCAKYGTAAARFEVSGPFGTETIWIEFGKHDEGAAKAQMAAKHPTIQNWVVIA